MVKLSHGEILEQLERHGLRHRTVAMQTEGEYLPTDVDWNNKDVLHRNHVHKLIDDVPCVVETDLQAAISLQRIAGIRVPLVLVHYDTETNRQTHFLTIGAWTMVTEHEFVPLSPTRTRAITTYTVAGNRFWMAFFPLIRILLKANYRQLMSEDVPMRERRGTLRSWGYSFRGDGERRDIRWTVPVGVDNVLPPDELRAPPPVTVPLDELRPDRWTQVGRSDRFGLKLRLEDGAVAAYPRLCPHEGADLSEIEPTRDCIVCPWHGRELGPVAVLDLDGDVSEASSPWHHLVRRDGSLRIEFRVPDAS